jgi:hypothetical protein
MVAKSRAPAVAGDSPRRARELGASLVQQDSGQEARSLIARPVPYGATVTQF